MANASNQDDLRAWTEYFESKGSLFYEECEKKMSPLGLKTQKWKKWTNIFFTICGFPPRATKEAKNANAFHVYYFDIDLRDNPNETKASIRQALRDVWGVFDFIVESRNGFHLYSLAPKWKYSATDGSKFLEDWLAKSVWLHKATWLVFDENIYDLSRISRIPWTYHWKDGDTASFQVVLLKGRDLLYSDGEQRKRKIDAIPICNVLDKLWIQYSIDNQNEWSIFEDGQKTHGWKIDILRNYVNDFSHKNRLVGWSYAFAKNFFLRKILSRNLGFSRKKCEDLAYGDTSNFFADEFGILPVGRRGKTIPIPREIEELFSDPRIKWKDIKISLWFFKFARDKFEDQCPYGRRIECTLSEFAHKSELSERPDELAAYLVEYRNNIPEIDGIFPIVRFETYKRSKEWIISFSVFPWKEMSKKLKSITYFGQHYLNARCLLLPTNSESIRFYLHLCSKFINFNKRKDFDMTKEEVKRFFQDSNYRRSKWKIQNIADITQDFHIENVKYWISFSKGRKRIPSSEIPEN